MAALGSHGIVIIVGDYGFATCFSRVMAPRHATATPTIPVETISPP